jgi:hypothetical protein
MRWNKRAVDFLLTSVFSFRISWKKYDLIIIYDFMFDIIITIIIGNSSAVSTTKIMKIYNVHITLYYV